MASSTPETGFGAPPAVASPAVAALTCAVAVSGEARDADGAGRLSERLARLRASATTYAPYAMATGGALGLALLTWLILETGPALLARHLTLLGPIFPLVLVLSATRYLLQASAWRLAMPRVSRPAFRLSVKAILASEAVGYLSWAGPVAREPVKLIFVRGMPLSVAVTASLVERSVYAGVSLSTVVLGVGLVATKGQQVWIAAGVAGAVALVALALRTRVPRASTDGAELTAAGKVRHRAAEFLYHRRRVVAAMAALSVVQVLISLAESWVVLDWLGARPDLVLVTAFEGMTKLANGAGSFVPGGIGVTEAAGAFAGRALHLGMTYGVSLALARRARALVWAGVGLVVLSRHGVSDEPAALDGPAPPKRS